MPAPASQPPRGGLVPPVDEPALAPELEPVPVLALPVPEPVPADPVEPVSLPIVPVLELEPAVVPVVCEGSMHLPTNEQKPPFPQET